jgi:hypothetical protein
LHAKLLILTHGFRPTESQETASADRPEKSIGAVQNTHTDPTTGNPERRRHAPSPTPPNLAARRLALSVALIPHLPPPHLRRSLLAQSTPCRRIPAPPSASAESLWASLPTWQELADEAQAAAVFFFSPAPRDAPGRSPGTCRRHHRREAAPRALLGQSLLPLILRIYVFNFGSAHAWLTPAPCDSIPSRLSRARGHGDDRRKRPGHESPRSLRRCRGTSWPLQAGRPVPSRPQKGTFFPALPLCRSSRRLILAPPSVHRLILTYTSATLQLYP